MGTTVRSVLAALTPALLSIGAAPAAAPAQPSWTETKCVRYRAAWDEALRRVGPAGLGQDFLERHAAFLRSGCELRAVCPRSPEEIRLADILTVAAMNFGTASTFLPFSCPRS